MVQAYSSVMFMAACILGPLLGGVLTDHVHWSLIFWINLPLGVVALVMTDRALRRLPRNDRPHKLDLARRGADGLRRRRAACWRWPGAACAIRWASPEIVGLFVGSVAAVGRVRVAAGARRRSRSSRSTC